MRKNQDFRSTLPLWAALSLVVIWLALLLASAYEEGMNIITISEALSYQMEHPFSIQWKPHSLKCILVCLILYGCSIGMYYTTRENRRPGEEYGSARWGNPRKLCQKYMDKKHPLENVILTQNVSISFDSYKHRRNLNMVIVEGG